MCGGANRTKVGLKLQIIESFEFRTDVLIEPRWD